MITDFLIPMITVGLAELGDKTQLSVVLLSSKTEKRIQLLLGVMLAFIIVDGIGILLGSWITNVVPENWLKTLSGIIFVVFGLMTLRSNATNAGNVLNRGSPFVSGFSLVFITEWGDKTQIAAGLLATKYNSLLVLLGCMVALTLLSVTAIWMGNLVSRRVDRKTMTRIAGLLFIAMGTSFLIL